MTAIFLSYNSADVAAASRLQAGLRGAGYATVFRDRDEAGGVPAGTLWVRELFANLERAQVVVFLASSASLVSPWCHTELAVAVARGRHVVQVSLGPVPVHPVLADRQALGPASDVPELLDRLVPALGRVGFPPGDPFGWDPDVSPYPGLHRLGAEHAAVLFGRDRETAELLGRLGRPAAPPVLVVGPSGSGKSSFLRAGALPRLALQRSTVLLPTVEPGTAPLRRVATALASRDGGLDLARLVDEPAGIAEAVDRLTVAGGRAVLALDQAEDLLAPHTREQSAELVRRLAAVDRDRLAVVVVLRSASLEAWLRDPELGAWTAADPLWVRPLGRAGLREVVVGPARLAGIGFDPPELVEQIVDDSGDGYALPLLAALLEELTEGHTRRTPAVVDRQRYETLGPVARVIERRATTAVAALGSELGVAEADVVKAYLRLVELPAGQPASRAEVVLATLPADVVEVFAVLERYRLVTRDRRQTGPGEVEDVVVPAHEEVLRAWPALREAITTSRADLELRSALRREARAWSSTGEGAVALAGGRLELALDWSRRHGDEVDREVRGYLLAATRQRRRRRNVLVAAPLLALVVLVVGALAVSLAVQARRADRARSLADGLRLAGESRAAAPDRPDLAVQLALEAAARGSDLQLQAAPLVALTQGPGPRRYQQLPGPAAAAALDADGRHAVLARGSATLLWDAAAGRAVATLPPAGTVAISGDGGTVATTAPEQSGGAAVDVRPWSGSAPGTSCPVPGGAVELVRLTSTGDGVVAVAVDRSVRPPVSTVSELRLPGCTVVATRDVPGLVVDLDVDDGQDRVVLGVADPTGTDPGVHLQVWQLSTGLPYEQPAPAPGVVRAVAQDDSSVAALTADGDLLVWDVRSLQTPPRLVATLPVAGAGLRPLPAADGGTTGRWLAYGVDGALHVVDPAADPAVGAGLQSLPELGWTGAVVPLAAATRDGVTTVDPSGRLLSWDVSGAVALGDVLLPGHRVDEVVTSAAGPLVLTGDDVLRFARDGTTTSLGVPGAVALAARGTLWAAGTRDGRVVAATGPGPAREVDRHAAGITCLAVLADGSTASADDGGRLQVVTPTGSRTAWDLGERPRSMASDGRHLFIGTFRGVLLVVDPRQPGRPPLVVPAHSADASAAAVSPDGRTLATGGDDRAVLVWDIRGDGSLHQRLRLVGQGDRVLGLSFSQDGRWLATSGEDHAVLLWDLTRGEQIGQAVQLPSALAVAFSGAGAGQQLLVGGQGLAGWPMTPAAWHDAACRLLGGRSLSAAERARYLRGSAPQARCGPGPMS